MFALKRLNKRDNLKEAQQKKDFQDELDALKRFGGVVHPHLVTLLATFTYREYYYFLFPYAECALDRYWEEVNQSPEFGAGMVRWVAEQMLGIMEATHIIHNPEHLNKLAAEPRYGRHGDIKPNNILWFKSPLNERGMLVISDMGLSKFNRVTSRSNYTAQGIPGACAYRPPEVEMKDGKVSRAFDIWTLGCLFLEMLTWLLGGADGLQAFEEKRDTIYINGQTNDVFFTIMEIPGSTEWAVQVKQEVRDVSHEIRCRKPQAFSSSHETTSGSTHFTVTRSALNLSMTSWNLSKTRCS
jgi:serine/threonine protein kinase